MRFARVKTQHPAKWVADDGLYTTCERQKVALMSAKKIASVKKVRGVLITPSCEVTPIEVENSLRVLWDVVGGYVARIPLKDGADLFANRESRALPLHKNALADDLIKRYERQPARLVVVGNALVLGEVQPSEDSTDIPDWVMKYLIKQAQ